MLSSLYQYADYAWIGGAYGKGLHNTLEAATFGLPIFFGNKVYTKFQEAMDLIAIGGAQVIDNTQTFESIFTSLYQDFNKRKEVSDKILTYVKSNIGSTQTIINFVKNLIQTTNK
jgi:3-deoxy-D-manno-octulosonic-acid transferase